GLLNEKVEASETQPKIFVGINQYMEKKGEFQPFECLFLVYVDIEEVEKSEDVKNNAILKLGHIGPYSIHFLTLCLVGN
ncbi:hypothetical protein HAX54_011411, partial [Datura stramonium]|nr:hypothetical protein [Datura stramonium]